MRVSLYINLLFARRQKKSILHIYNTVVNALKENQSNKVAIVIEHTIQWGKMGILLRH